jgi:hypothetical protein
MRAIPCQESVTTTLGQHAMHGLAFQRGVKLQPGAYLGANAKC